jgi:hypothetical protein
MPSLAQAQSTEEGNFEQIGVNFDLRHMGNSTRVAPSTAAGRGLVAADERLTVGVDLVVNRELGRNTLRLTTNLGYDFYRRNEKLNRERIGAQLDAGINIGSCLLELSGQVDRRQSDLDTIALVNLPGTESVRNTQTTQNYRAQGRCGYAFGLRPSVGYEHSVGDNSNILREVSDYTSDRVFGGLAYEHPVVGKINLTYETEDVNFSKRAATPLAAFSGYKLDELRLRVSRDIGSSLKAEGLLAYNWLKSDNGAAPNFRGVTWRLSGTAKIGSRLQIRGGTERSLRPSLGAEALYSKSSSHDLRATYALSKRFSINGGLVLSKRDYEGAQANFGPLLDKDKFRRVFAGMTFRASEKLDLGFEAGHEKRDGTGTLYDYDSGYVGLRGRIRI